MASINEESTHARLKDENIPCVTEVFGGRHRISFLTPNPNGYRTRDILIAEFVEVALGKHEELDENTEDPDMLKDKGSNPGHGETLDIDATSALFWTGIEHSLPQVVAGIGQKWSAVKSSI